MRSTQVTISMDILRGEDEIPVTVMAYVKTYPGSFSGPPEDCCEDDAVVDETSLEAWDDNRAPVELDDIEYEKACDLLIQAAWEER